MKVKQPISLTWGPFRLQIVAKPMTKIAGQSAGVFLDSLKTSAEPFKDRRGRLTGHRRKSQGKQTEKP